MAIWQFLEIEEKNWKIVENPIQFIQEHTILKDIFTMKSKARLGSEVD